MGSLRPNVRHSQIRKALSFHSISFPSEWGGGKIHSRNDLLGCSVSIQLVSPASGERFRLYGFRSDTYGFHSISFPSEWGVEIIHFRDMTFDADEVSIQLVSPASGES